MNKTTEALKLAKEAIEQRYECHTLMQKEVKALAAIREALADHFAASGKQIDEPVKPEPIAWEATSAGVIKFVTDSRYKKFSQNIQQYYKPYRCSHCSEPVKQEPVAYMVKAHDSVQRFAVRADVADEFACKWRETDPDADFYPLYAAPVDAKAIDFDTWMKHPYTIELNKSVKEDYIPATDAKAIRAEALEEAAKVCDDESRYSNDAECCAAVIRSLK